MSDLYRSRAPRSSSRRQQQTALPAEITTPVAQAFSSEYQAAAEVNKQAEEQDLIKQQQEAEQERQQINRQSVATAKKVGQQTQMDPLTGAESVKKDTATGKPVWEAGFVGDPTPDNEGKTVVPYRFPDGRTLQVPLDRINKKTEKTGENFLEFDYQDETGNTQRIRRPEDKSKPLFQTDEATGQRYRDVPDATGSMVRQPLGIDPVAANQARINKRKEAYAKEKEALKFQEDTLQLEMQGEELNLKPLKEKLTEAEKLAKQYAPEAAKDKSRYEQRPDGLYRVDGAFGDLPAIPRKIETPDEIAAANNWLRQKEQADKQLQGIKAEHDPIEQRVRDMEKRRNALAKQALAASKRAQTDMADMEIAAKAGMDLSRPQWKQVLDIAKKDDRFQQIIAAGEAADQGSLLADAIAGAVARHNKSVNDQSVLEDAARAFDYLNAKAPKTMAEESAAAQVQAEQATKTALVDMLASGVRGDKGTVDATDQAKATEIATKSLGVQDPENWSLSPDNRGNYNLHHTSDEAPLGWLDTKNKRVMLFPSATVTDAGQQLLEKASADGFPVFHMGSEATGGGVPMTHQELRDYVAKGVEIARSAATPDEKEALLAKEGITPTDIREQVMAGRMSVQDGRWLNEKLFEEKELDNSPGGYAKGFAEYLAANPAQEKIMATGNREQKLAVANNYSDARAGQSSAGNLFFQRDTMADRRVELAQKVAPTGKVEKLTTGAKQILAPMVGLLAQMPAWAFQEALKRAGSETEAGRLADEQFGDWQKRTSGFFHRINARDDVTESLTEFKQWANRARPGEQPPDELANKVAKSVFDGYHQLTEESARDLNTSLDTFNVNKDPKLQALLQRYLTTSDPSAFEQMASMMVMDGKDRKTQAEVMKYIERPRAATPELVADRAKELGLNIQLGAAPRLLEMATALGNSKDDKQSRSILTQVGKMLGTTTDSDTLHALHTITTEATDDPDSFWGLTKGGFVAGRQEAVTELASTALEGGLAMLTGGAATPEILAGKAARRTAMSTMRAAIKRTATASLDALADESKLFAATRAGFNRGRAKLGSVIAKDAEAFAKEGITTPKFGVPLTAGQKLKNAAVTVGKTAAAAAPIEAGEEGVAAIGDVDPTVRGTIEQMGMGAIGAGLITPIFLGAAATRNVFQARKAENMLGQAKAKWVEKFNERMAKTPGFQPITVADYDVWSGLQDNAAHKEATTEYQAALAEMLAAEQEAASAPAPNPVAGPATAAPPAPQTTPGATPDATSQRGQGQGQEVLTPAPEPTPVAEAQPAPATTPEAAPTEEEPVLAPDSEQNVAPEDMPFSAPARPQTPRQIAAQARLEVAEQNLAGLSQIAFSAADELRAVPEADRPLYTAVAKAKAGSTIYTADEAKALIRQNGANAVTFQKAEILPPDVQGPRNLKTLSELPDAIKVGPALYRLPEGVQIAIPDALTASVVSNAPSLGILLQTSAQAQAAAKPTVSPEYLKQWEQFGTVKSEGGSVAVTSDTRKAHEAAMFALKQAGIKPSKVVTGPKADGKTEYTILFDAPEASRTKPQAKQFTIAPAKDIIQQVAKANPKIVALLHPTPNANTSRDNGGMWIGKDENSIEIHFETLDTQLAALQARGRIKSAEQAAEHVQAVLDEEIRHIANIEASRRLHKKIAPDEDYATWREAYYGKMWREEFNEDQRKAVMDAYGDTLKGASDYIKALEGLRMVSQVGSKWGKITEAVLFHLDQVLKVLRELVAKPSKAIQEEIENIKAVLAEYGYDTEAVSNDTKAEETPEITIKVKKDKVDEMRTLAFADPQDAAIFQMADKIDSLNKEMKPEDRKKLTAEIAAFADALAAKLTADGTPTTRQQVLGIASKGKDAGPGLIRAYAGRVRTQAIEGNIFEPFTPQTFESYTKHGNVKAPSGSNLTEIAKDKLIDPTGLDIISQIKELGRLAYNPDAPRTGEWEWYYALQENAKGTKLSLKEIASRAAQGNVEDPAALLAWVNRNVLSQNPGTGLSPDDAADQLSSGELGQTTPVTATELGPKILEAIAQRQNAMGKPATLDDKQAAEGDAVAAQELADMEAESLRTGKTVQEIMAERDAAAAAAMKEDAEEPAKQQESRYTAPVTNRKPETRESLNAVKTEGSEAPLNPRVANFDSMFDTLDADPLVAVQKNLPGITTPPTNAADKALVERASVLAGKKGGPAGVIPPFQGNKRDMILHAIPAILRYWTAEQRGQITELWDMFAGGGAWGLLVANQLFPNVKVIHVNEFDPIRAAKVRWQIEKGNTFEKSILDPRTQMALQTWLDAHYSQSEGNSWSSIRDSLRTMLEARQDAVTPEALGALVMILDDPSLSTPWESDDSKATVAEVTKWALSRHAVSAREIHKTAQQMRDRGVEFKFYNGDAYELPVTPGPGTFVLADPPYIFTLGYKGDDIVGNDIYSKTADLMERLVAQENHIAYTDEAWWIKPTLSDVVSDGAMADAAKTTARIANTIDLTVVADLIGNRRYETLGLHNPLGSPLASNRPSDRTQPDSQNADGRTLSGGQQGDGRDSEGAVAEGTLDQAGIQPTADGEVEDTPFSSPATLRAEILESQKGYISPKFKGSKAWLTPDGRWINVVEHYELAPPNFWETNKGFDRDLTGEAKAAGFARVVYDRNSGQLISEHDTLTPAQRSELKNTATELFADLVYDRGGLFSAPAIPLVEPGFYSQLQKVITEKMPNKADAKTIRGIITNPQTGIKADELKWTGVLNWLDEQTGTITKEQIGKYLADEGAVRFKEVRFGGESEQEYDPDSGDRITGTKHSTWVTPGGTNYREVVLTMPIDATQGKGWQDYRDQLLQNGMDAKDADEVRRWAAGQPEENVNMDAIAKARSMLGEKWLKAYRAAMTGDTKVKEVQYTSSHFSDVPNYVAHSRLNDRTDADGKPGTFIEEMQSDRHQQARKKGYKGDTADIATEAEIKRFYNGKGDMPEAEWETLARRVKNELDQRNSIPDAPFRQSEQWGMHLFKRALKQAVDAGHAWIGWTKGIDQITRYSDALRQAVDRISWVENGAVRSKEEQDAAARTLAEHAAALEAQRDNLPDDFYIRQKEDLAERRANLQQEIDMASEKLVRAEKNGQVTFRGRIDKTGTFMDGPAAGKSIDEVLGKEVAAKIESDVAGDLKGDNLTIGGEGMKGFYDQIMPKAVGKYVKQWGSKVEESNIDVSEGKPLTGREANQDGVATIWKVAITDQMKEGVERGQALFSAPARGYESMTFDPPFKTSFGDIVSYDWMSKPVGGMTSQQVSDWNQARTNPVTGRPIVHHFRVRGPDGMATVSLETALGRLSPPDRSKLSGMIRTEQRRRQEEAAGQMTLFSSAASVGATPGKEADAAAQWDKLGHQSPYFKAWTQGTRIIPLGSRHDYKTGEPVTIEAIHGTFEQFNDWDPSKFGITDDIEDDMLGRGVYSTQSKGQQYGNGTAARVFVRLKNPIVVTGPEELFEAMEKAPKLPNGEFYKGIAGVMQAIGYDGAIAKLGGEASEIVAFDPANAAIAEWGTFKGMIRNSMLKDTKPKVAPTKVVPAMEQLTLFSSPAIRPNALDPNWLNAERSGFVTDGKKLYKIDWKVAPYFQTGYPATMEHSGKEASLTIQTRESLPEGGQGRVKRFTIPKDTLHPIANAEKWHEASQAQQPVITRESAAQTGTLLPDGAVLSDGPGMVQMPLFAAPPQLYHGTPHEIDPETGFSTRYIGTGEGAQAYGWGLYFAQLRGIAEGYKKKLSKAKVLYNGKTAYPVELLRATPTVFESGDPDKIIAAALEAPNQGNSNNINSRWPRDANADNLIKWARTISPKMTNATEDRLTDIAWDIEFSKVTYSKDQGNLYTVELLPDTEEFIHWDDDIGEQPAAVRAKLQPFIDEISMHHIEDSQDPNNLFYGTNPDHRYIITDWTHDHTDNETDSLEEAKDIARQLTENVLETRMHEAFADAQRRKYKPKELSEHLLSLGVPGVRYLDWASRDRPGELYQAKKNVHAWQTHVDNGMPGAAPQLAKAQKALEEAQRKFDARTFNYVLFDEKLVRMIEANGEKIKKPERLEQAALFAAPAVRHKRSVAELERLALDQEGFKNWYSDFASYLNDFVGEHQEYAPLIGEFLSATSAATSVNSNVPLAVKAIKLFIETGIIDDSFRGHSGNLERAARGEQLSGPKISQYSDAIFGVIDAIPVDRHIADLMFGTDKPTDRQIAAAKTRIRNIAGRLGWEPRQVMAALWAANQKRKGLPSESYETHLAKHRDALHDLFAKDRAGEGRGLRASRLIAQRISERRRAADGNRGQDTGGQRLVASSPAVRDAQAIVANLDKVQAVRPLNAQETAAYAKAKASLETSPTTQSTQQQQINELHDDLRKANAGRSNSPVQEEWLKKQAESLRQWAVRNGKLIDSQTGLWNASNDRLGGGDEHDVWYDPKTNRVVKLTKPDGWGLQWDLTRYLDYITAANDLFGDDMRIEGVTEINGWPHIIISQPFYRGEMATEAEIDGYFATKGYKPAPVDAYRKDDVTIYDAKPRNVLRLTDGTIMPIDVQIRTEKPSLDAGDLLGSAPAQNANEPSPGGLSEAGVKAWSALERVVSTWPQSRLDPDTELDAWIEFKQDQMPDAIIVIERIYKPLFRDIQAAWNWDVAKTGSQYIHGEIPLSYNEDNEPLDTKEFKISVRDHGVSPFREKELGHNTKVIEIDSFADPVQVKRAFQRVVKELDRLFQLSPKANAEPLAESGAAGIKPKFEVGETGTSPQTPPSVNPNLNPTGAEGRALMASPATDKQADMRQALDTMPPIWREVLESSMNGQDADTIAARLNIPTEHVGNIQRVAEARLRILLDAAAGKLKPSVQLVQENWYEPPTLKATAGRPDLALSGIPAVTAVDQRRAGPEEVTHAEMQTMANRMFALDLPATERMLKAWMESGGMTIDAESAPDGIKDIVKAANARQAGHMLMTAAAKLMVTRYALTGTNMLETANLIDLYRNTGTEQARAMNMRRDPQQSPAERAAMFIQEALLTPPQHIQNEIAKNPGNKAEILKRWVTRAERIKRELIAEGYDIDATFQQFHVEQQLADAVVPESVQPVLEQADTATQRVVRSILEGESWAEAARRAGTPIATAREAYNAFRQGVKDAYQAFKAEFLGASPADQISLLGLPEWTVDTNPDAVPVQTEATKALKQHRARRKTGGEIDLSNPLAVNRVQRAVETRKATAFDKLSEYWRASILTGPQTHVVNIVSGLTYGGYEATVKKLGAGALADIARMFGMKPDAASLSDMPAMLAATLPAVRQAFMDSIRSFQFESRMFDSYAEGQSPTAKNSNPFKEQYQPALKGTLGTIMRGASFRLMGAADEFVKSFFTRIEVAAQARQIARAQGHKGVALANAISEQMQPGSLAWLRALEHAKKITFQTKLGSTEDTISKLDGLAKIINSTKQGRFGSLPKGISHFIFPFVDTPTNIFKQAVTISPLGGLLAIVDATQALRRLKQGNKEQAAKLYNAARALSDITNQVVAWGAVLAIAELVKPGDDDDKLPFLTGTIPWRAVSKGEREIAYRTAPPQSIRIGDTWYSYRRLDPFATALAFMVDSIRDLQSGKPADEILPKIGVNMLHNLQDKTFLQGISDFMNAVQDPNRFGTKWATNIATGFMPNLVRQSIRSGDGVFRETDLPNDMPFWDVLGRRIGFGVYPVGWDDGALPRNPLAPLPATDVWGRPASKNTGTGGPNTDMLLRLFSPVDTRDTANVDPLDVRLLRWNMANPDDAFAMTAPTREIKRTIDGKPVSVSLSDAEHADLTTRSGQAARQAIGNRYNDRDLTKGDVKQIRQVTDKAHDMYRELAFRKHYKP